MRWRLFRRPQVPENPEPPWGIVLRTGGRDIRCIALRDEDQDEPGCVAWLAVPAEDFLLRRGQGFELFVRDPPDGHMPDDCVILPGFRIPGAVGGAWPGSR